MIQVTSPPIAEIAFEKLMQIDKQGWILGKLRGWSPLLKILFILGALPPKFLYCSCFSKCINLAPNIFYCIFMMNLLIDTWLLRSWLYYIITRLYYHYSTLENMGVVTTRTTLIYDIALSPHPTLVKVFRNKPC